MTNAQRVKQVRTRARIRNWEFRQRHLARGAWHQFRLALAAAHEAYAISEAQFAELVAEGVATDDRGRRLEPPRQIAWITAERATQLGGRQLALRFDGELLAARALALVPFKKE